MSFGDTVLPLPHAACMRVQSARSLVMDHRQALSRRILHIQQQNIHLHNQKSQVIHLICYTGEGTSKASSDACQLLHID